MANLYYAKKIEEIYFEALKKTKIEPEQSQNSLHLVSIDMNTPDLKPLDFANEEHTNSEITIESYQTPENTVEEPIIQKPDMTAKNDSIRMSPDG